MKKNLIFNIAALAFVFCFWACEDDVEKASGFTTEQESVSVIIGNKAKINVVYDGSLDTREIKWTSKNEDIATVTDYGVIFAVEEGKTEIEATWNGNTKTVPVTVIDPVVLPPRKASWLFEDPGNLFKADVGQALVPGTGVPAVFGGTAGFSATAGPSADNSAIHVIRGNFLKAIHGFAPNGGGAKVNEWTIFYYLKCSPEYKDNNYKSLLKTKTEDNTRDADFFMRKDYIGGGSLPGSPAGSVTPDVWNRLVVSIKNGQFCNVCLNGVLISQTASNYRSIDDERSSLLPSCLIFADEDGEDVAWDVAEIAMWDTALDEQQVKKLERLLGKGIRP
ncbi:hypothetical protein FACS189446_3800 [Bacteroidia bacterium]|nr:hypothetical protein FACS189446_3800 [Bacteroidia bacterium]